ARVLIHGFRAARERRGEPATSCDVYLAIQTELSLRHDAVRIAEARAADARTWMYLFSWRSPARDGVMGACHALDLPFVFGNLDAPGMPAFAGEGADAQPLAEAMMDAWTAFAHGEAPWPSSGRRRSTRSACCWSGSSLRSLALRDRFRIAEVGDLGRSESPLAQNLV